MAEVILNWLLDQIDPHRKKTHVKFRKMVSYKLNYIPLCIAKLLLAYWITMQVSCHGGDSYIEVMCTPNYWLYLVWFLVILILWVSAEKYPGAEINAKFDNHVHEGLGSIVTILNNRPRTTGSFSVPSNSNVRRDKERHIQAILQSDTFRQGFAPFLNGSDYREDRIYKAKCALLSILSSVVPVVWMQYDVWQRERQFICPVLNTAVFPCIDPGVIGLQLMVTVVTGVTMIKTGLAIYELRDALKGKGARNETVLAETIYRDTSEAAQRFQEFIFAQLCAQVNV